MDAAQALRELDSLAKLRNEQAATNLSARQKVLAEAAEGGSSAAESYKKAVEALHTGSNADFDDWSRDKADLLRSEQMQNAIMLHARYLLLGMEARQAAAKPPGATEQTAREFLGYSRQLAELISKEKWFGSAPREAKELLEKPVQDEVFVRWLGLGDYLPSKESWEEKPGNIEGILEKNVRVPLRASKEASVLAAWDAQIDFLRQRALHSSEAAKTKINQTDLPRALYSHALDKKLLGLRNGFLRDTLALTKQHAGHPDWDKWAKSLRDELSRGQSSHPVEKSARDTAAKE